MIYFYIPSNILLKEGESIRFISNRFPFFFLKKIGSHFVFNSDILYNKLIISQHPKPLITTIEVTANFLLQIFQELFDLTSKKEKIIITISVIVSAIIIVVSITIPVLQFLDSIHYNIYEYIFNAEDPIHDFEQHQKEFDLLVSEIDGFVENQPDLFERLTGECFVEDNGLIFFQKQLPYPENKVFHKFTVENWESIHNFHKVFPHDFFYLDIMLYPEYPDYIFFCSDERSWRVLVYTRGEKPHKLIEQYREKYDFVRVREVAPGWYDISS